MTAPLISFIIPTRRPENIRGFFDNIEATAKDPSCVEVLIKYDNDQPGIREFMEEEIARRPFTIKYIITPRLEGTFSLWVGVEQLFFMSNPDSYFVTIMSDEPRFETPHWDEVLRNKYMHYYEDDVFRLRISTMKLANYATHYECTFKPDSFPIYTRRWLELTEGTGDCWGSDAYHQCIAYHLWLGPKSYYNVYRTGSLYRDLPVFDLEFSGMEFGVGVGEADQKERHWRNLREWKRLSSHLKQEEFSYLARRIYAYIWAYENGIEDFRMLRNPMRKTVSLKGPDGKELLEVSYAVPRLVVYSQNLLRNFLIIPQYGYVQANRWIAGPFDRLTAALKRAFYETAYFIYAILFTSKHSREYLNSIWVKVARFFAENIRKASLAVYRYLPHSLRPYAKGLWKLSSRILGRPVPRPTPQRLTYKRRFFRMMRRNIQRLKLVLLVPVHACFKLLEPLIITPPPGLSVLGSKNVRLPPRVKPPTSEEIAEARHILAERTSAQKALRGKNFHIKSDGRLTVAKAS